MSCTLPPKAKGQDGSCVKKAGVHGIHRPHLPPPAPGSGSYGQNPRYVIGISALNLLEVGNSCVLCNEKLKHKGGITGLVWATWNTWILSEAATVYRGGGGELVGATWSMWILSEAATV